jgi:hypothetical protein
MKTASFGIAIALLSTEAVLAFVPTHRHIEVAAMAATVGGKGDQFNESPRARVNNAADKFRNDGPFSWMQTYLEDMGVKEGKTVYYGPMAVDVDPTKRVSKEEINRLRKQAAQDLINIGPEERQRRNQAGNVMAAFTALYIIWASLIADDGGAGGHILRFLAFFPAFLAVGYKVSAQQGLCNIAQAGVWDVDGSGLSKIDDPNTARAILRKVNKMNIENILKVGIPITIFASLPKSSTAPFVFLTVVYAALYFFKDDIPTSEKMK